jgi:tRNA pseudouridine38-40 synthase
MSGGKARNGRGTTSGGSGRNNANSRNSRDSRKSRNICLLVEYDGSDFAGFQKQPRKRTIQGELERCLRRLLGHPVKITGAGRTDAGVHALGQVANFVTSNPIPAERIPAALNRVLPAGIFVRAAWQAPEQFHARKSARWRAYRYAILTGVEGSAVAGRFCHTEPGLLRIGAMREAAAHLRGRQDYASFASGASGSTVRNVRRLTIRKEGRFVFITVEADAFLRQMVRAMVGVLLRVGRGEMEPGEVAAIVAARDRRGAGKAAPARGLYLIGVGY